MKKCRVQFLNVYTQEILRDELMKKEFAEDLIQDMVYPKAPKLQGETTFIMDSQMRIFKAKYISYKESFEDDVKVYKVFFQVRLNEKQIPIKR